MVDPLPHQITAVYESMLPCQPLCFLLPDDPGACKTIMAGLLMRELIARGDLQRCLVVSPGFLAQQWQDELFRRFHLPLEILASDKLHATRTGNWFLETNLVIARLDQLSRNEALQEKFEASEAHWDLVVCGRCRMHGRRSLRGTLSPAWHHGRAAPLLAYTGGAQDKRMQPWIARRLAARGSKARVHWELRRWQTREFAYFQWMRLEQRERGLPPGLG